jgi:hypothetical protein
MHMPKANGGGLGTPWDDQVAHLMRREGIPRDKARDRIIFDQLKRGNSNALAALLIDGHVPAPRLRLLVALMLLDNDEFDAAIARHHVDPELRQLPHRFVIKPRPARPRRSHEAEKNQGRSATGTGRLMPDLGYEAAIARIDEAVRAADSVADRAGGKPTARDRPRGKKPRK